MLSRQVRGRMVRSSPVNFDGVTNRQTWAETRLAMARVIAMRSLCVRDQVGAIIVDSGNKVIGEGYNGPPSKFWHSNQPCTSWCQRAKNAKLDPVDEPQVDYSDCPSLHAEANALMMSDRTLRSGGTIYVTSHICMGCAKLIANSGLRYVVIDSPDEHEHRRSDASYSFLHTSGLHVIVNGKSVLA